LLCIQHQKDGRINPQVFAGLTLGFNQVSEKFVFDADGYYNERLELEILKRKRATNASRENGKKGGRPRSNPSVISEINPQVSSRLTKTEPRNNLSENEIENENRTESKKEKALPQKKQPPTKPELKFPFASEVFMAKWEILVSQPKWRKKTFAALQESLNKLARVAEPEAIEMLSNSISGGWQGLFPASNGKSPPTEQLHRQYNTEVVTIAEALNQKQSGKTF
jgi:hypothetical protein